MFLLGIEMGNGCKRSLHLVIARKTPLEHKLSCNMQNKFLLGSLCHYRNIAVFVMRCKFGDVINVL